MTIMSIKLKKVKNLNEITLNHVDQTEKSKKFE
jgi:phage FluMu protein Com